MSQPLESTTNNLNILYSRIMSVLTDYETEKEMVVTRILMMRGSDWRMERAITQLNDKYNATLTPFIVNYAHIAPHANTHELVQHIRRIFSERVSLAVDAILLAPIPLIRTPALESIR